MKSKKYFIVKANNRVDTKNYSKTAFTNSIVRLIDRDLVVHVHGKKYRGKSLLELHKRLIAGQFPYIIEVCSDTESDAIKELKNVYVTSSSSR